MTRSVRPEKINERGAALILVVFIMAAIVAAALQFNRAARLQVYEAAGIGDGIVLEHIAKSGIYIGKYVLKEEDEEVVTLRDDWARAEEVSFQSAAFFSVGHCEVRVVDESGKIPVNKLVDGEGEINESIRDLLVRFFTLPEFGLNDRDAYDIVAAIADWIDEDDEITIGDDGGLGAEQGYYRSLDPPYDCKNAPFDSIDELMLIKGITEELYHGADGLPGIRDYLTVRKTERININTAPLLVLRSLSPDMTEKMATWMDEYRRDDNNELDSPSWYLNISGMGGVEIDSLLIGTSSDVFSIQSTGRLDRMIRRITAEVERKESGDMPVVLSWTVH